MAMRLRIPAQQRLQVGFSGRIEPACAAAFRPFHQVPHPLAAPAGDPAIGRALTTGKGVGHLGERLAIGQQQRPRALLTPRLAGVGRGILQVSPLVGGSAQGP